MRYILTLLSSIVVFFNNVSIAQNIPPEGFEALFNGKDLKGWFGHGTKDPRTLWKMSPEELKKHQEETLKDINAHWSVKDGELINDGKGLYLTTKKDYKDFELLLEYKTVPKADSGIYLRGVPQVQIWDPTEEAKWKIGADKGSGGLWNNSKGAPGKDPLKRMDKPFGEWSISIFEEIPSGYHLRIWAAPRGLLVWSNLQDQKSISSSRNKGQLLCFSKWKFRHSERPLRRKFQDQKSL